MIKGHDLPLLEKEKLRLKELDSRVLNDHPRSTRSQKKPNKQIIPRKPKELTQNQERRGDPQGGGGDPPGQEETEELK